MTPHIECDKSKIAPLVIMPGDPRRAKYIAEKFLDDAVLVNSVREEYAYTGYYKGVRVTVFSSGMGNASMGIYSHELFSFYDVVCVNLNVTCLTLHSAQRLMNHNFAVRQSTSFSFSTA